MTQRQSVLLVSRALSLIWGVAGADEVTYLPERLRSFLHYVNRDSFLGLSKDDSYFGGTYRLEIALLFLRIGIYLILAFVFWKCGPLVNRTLMPETIETDPMA